MIINLNFDNGLAFVCNQWHEVNMFVPASRQAGVVDRKPGTLVKSHIGSKIVRTLNDWTNFIMNNLVNWSCNKDVKIKILIFTHLCLL